MNSVWPSKRFGKINGQADSNDCPKSPWIIKDEDRKKRGWAKDIAGGWAKDEGMFENITSHEREGYGIINHQNIVKSPTDNLKNNLWNRRRTCSTTNIPSLPAGVQPVSPLSTEITNSYNRNSRGASASPKLPHSTGFWIQEPGDIHQRWVTTDPSSSSNLQSPPIPWKYAKTDEIGGGMSSYKPLQKTFLAQQMMPDDSGFDCVEGIQLPGNNQIPPSTSRIFSNTSSTQSQQVKRSQLSTSHSRSSTNLCEQKMLPTSSGAKSSTNLTELKVASTKSSNLSELQSSISEVKSNINEMTSQNNSVNFSKTMSKSSSSASSAFSKLNCADLTSIGSDIRTSMGSLEALGNELQLPGGEGLALSLGEPLETSSLRSASPHNGKKELKFEEKKVTSSSKTKFVTDNNSYESASGHQSESRKLQSGDISYEESSKKAASKSKLEIDGISAEKAYAIAEESRQLRAGDLSVREGSQKKGEAVKLSVGGFSAHASALSEQQQRQMITPGGTINQESSRKSSKTGITLNTGGKFSQKSSIMMSSNNNISIKGFEDFDLLNDYSNPIDVQNAIMKFSSTISNFVDELKCVGSEGVGEASGLLENMNTMLSKAWSVPIYGQELGSSLCNVLRHNGGLDMLLQNCNSVDDDLKFSSAKILEQCLTTDNRGYVVEHGLDKVVGVACDCAQNSVSIDQSRVGTGILEHLFKHSEGTCSDIIKMGGLDAVIKECRNIDKATLQHCAGALANLSLYGGNENQLEMMKQKVEHWLFPLAFHEDDNIKYYACLAIAALVANKEIEAAVTKSGSLCLVEPFVNAHLPEEFANSTEAHRHGQSKSWLARLVPVLRSNREEACNLAAFHFSMEAGIKKKQGNLSMFKDIGAIEPLKELASSPNAIASKYAAQALKLMGEEVPHKLSQQVPLWSTEDVTEWVKRIGFESYEEAFRESKVDGDLLLRIEDINLKEDIGVKNGILRQRFLRELRKLKRIADYSSCDGTKLIDFLVKLDHEFAEYAYPMLQMGVSAENISLLTEEQLSQECGIYNSIHRNVIRNAICGVDLTSNQNDVEKCLDVFISYRRSNGSQLASLLKVHMSLRSFSVFIDVERLEAGKFDNNLLSSIRQAKNFLLVLSSNALDRCIGDEDCKDWVHREIVAAVQSGCNIIPILDNFQWPDPDKLPEDMRSICHFNGVRWIHDYQDACVDKLERFMRGEGSRENCGFSRFSSGSNCGILTPVTPSTLTRASPMFQRTTSIESGKGSSCSDKDFSKD